MSERRVRRLAEKIEQHAQQRRIDVPEAGGGLHTALRRSAARVRRAGHRTGSELGRGRVVRFTPTLGKAEIA
jgi:hypothetical protein